MKYSANMVLRRLYTNCFSYLVLAIQFSVGIAFIAFALNHIFSAEIKMKSVKMRVGVNDVRIQMSVKEGADKSAVPITYTEYIDIKKTMAGNAEMEAYTEEPIQDTGDSIYYVFTDICNKKLGNNSVYVPQKIYDFIIREGENLLSDVIAVQNGKLVDLYTNNKFEIKILPKELEKEVLLVNDTGTVDFRQSIVFPLAALGNRPWMEYNLLIQNQDAATGSNQVEQIVDNLQMLHGEEGQYLLKNPLDEQQYYFDYMTLIPKYLGKLAAIMFLVMLFGFSGMLYLCVKRREKEYAVCYAVGEDRLRISREIIMEILSVCFIAAAAGNILCVIMMKIKVFDSLFSVHYSLITVFITLGIACAVTAIVSVPSIFKIARLEPAKLLQSM